MDEKKVVGKWPRLQCLCSLQIYASHDLLFFSCRKSMKYSRLNLDRLQYFIDSGRINPDEPITMRVLRMSGAVSGKIVDGVKLLGIV